MLLQESQHALAMLHQLSQLGVRMVLDDFGTGHCSLSNLRAFPFDAIKLDSSLIADLRQHEGSRAIAQSVLALGSRLAMTTMARGIEDLDQLNLMRGWGCQRAQGAALGPPVPAVEAQRLIGEYAQPPRVSPASDGNGAPPASWQAA